MPLGSSPRCLLGLAAAFLLGLAAPFLLGLAAAFLRAPPEVLADLGEGLINSKYH